MTPEEAEELVGSINERYTSRVGDLGDLGSRTEVDPRPGNGAYELGGERNVMQFFDKLQDRLEKTVDKEFENRRASSPARQHALEAIKKAEQEDPNAKRWKGLGTLVSKEVERRYSVHEAKQVYGAIDHANDMQRKVDLAKEMKGIANHDTYTAYKEQAEDFAGEFVERMGRVYVDSGEAAQAFSTVAREDGFQEAMRVMVQEPSRYGAVQSDQEHLWAVRQDFGRSVESAEQGILEYDEGGIGRAAAKAQIASALEVEMRVRSGEQVPEEVYTAVSKQIKDLQNEYARLDYKVTHSPSPDDLRQEAGRMLDAADARTHDHIRTLSEGAQERITLMNNSQRVLQTNDRVDNLFRELYASPDDARIRFENAAFPDGVQGDTEEYKRAMGAMVRNPNNYGKLRDGLSREQGQKIAKQLSKEMADHVSATEQLRASIQKQSNAGSDRGRHLGPKEAIDKAQKSANPQKYMRTQLLVRAARTVSARVKEAAGFDRY